MIHQHTEHYTGGVNTISEFSINDEHLKNFKFKITTDGNSNGTIHHEGSFVGSADSQLTEDWHKEIANKTTNAHDRLIGQRAVEIEAQELGIDKDALEYLKNNNLGDSDAARILEAKINTIREQTEKLYGHVFKDGTTAAHPAETPAPHVPVESAIPETVTNHFGLKIPTSEPHIYEVKTPTGEIYRAVFGGSDEARFKFAQDFLSSPENQGTPIRFVHTVHSMLGDRIQVDELGAETTAGHTSWLANFFAKPVEAPDPKDFEKIIK